MSVLDDIRSNAEAAAHGSFDEAKTLVKQASDEARELEQSAAGHGWAGVAQAMSSAQETLDEAAGVIDNAITAASEGITQLSEITEEMSSDEVARRLSQVGQRFETARGAAETLASAVTDTESEQSEATTWGKLTGGGGPRGQPSPRSGEDASSIEVVSAGGRSAGAGGAPPTLPQGLTAEQFARAMTTAREGTRHLGGDLAVHGSRAAGTAGPNSDIDFAVRVDEARFDELISERFGRPNPALRRRHPTTRGDQLIRNGTPRLTDVRRGVLGGGTCLYSNSRHGLVAQMRRQRVR